MTVINNWDLQNVMFIRSSMSFQCPRCRQWFDPTHGVDGNYSVTKGRLERIARQFVERSPEELRELQERLWEIENQRDAVAIGAELERLGLPRPAGGWARTRYAMTRTVRAADTVLDIIGRLLLLHDGAIAFEQSDALHLVESLLRPHFG